METTSTRQGGGGVILMAMLLIAAALLFALMSAASAVGSSGSAAFVSVADQFKQSIPARTQGSVAQSVTSNTTHADGKHVTAPQVRTMVHERNGACSEIYFSPTNGTVLVLCHLSGDQWGGGVFRVTENMGTRWLGDEGYECTIFVAKRSYWDGVIARDSYLAPTGDILGQFSAWIGW